MFGPTLGVATSAWALRPSRLQPFSEELGAPHEGMYSMKSGVLSQIKGTGIVVALWIVLLAFFFPIFWLFLSSLKCQADLFAMPPKFIDFTPTLRGYIDLLGTTGFPRFFINSLVMSVCSVSIAVAAGTAAAYGLTRLGQRSTKNLSFYIISTRVAPPIVVIVPFYLLARKIPFLLGGLDSYRLLIMIYTAMNLPLVVWMMQSFMRQIPPEIDEAATIDGCSRLQTLRFVMLPLLFPGLIATTVMSFVYAWNEFFFAFLLTARVAKTLPVGLVGFVSMEGMRWDEITASGVLVLLPIIVFGLVVHRRFIEGLLGGASKA